MKHHFALMALIGLYSAFSPLSAAQAAQNGRAWLSLIQSLESKGVTRVGSLNLRSFRERAAKVPFLSYNELPPSVLAGSRTSAFYLTYKKVVYILPRQPEADISALPQLELHELLGALGYGDADTSKSSALVIIDQAENAGERRALVERYAGTIFAPGEDASSGGFSVGGGGDLAMLHLKTEVLRYVRGLDSQNRGMVSSDFFAKFPAVAFEPMRKSKKIGLRYQFRLKTKRDYAESFSVFVPMNRWEAGEESRASLVEEIAYKLLALFPAEKNYATSSFSPANCGGKRINFPYTSDPEILSLQNKRGSVILGCDTFSGTQAGGTVVGTPGEAPKSPGVQEFSCTFSASGASVSPPEASLKAPVISRGRILSTRFSLAPGDFGLGSLYINEDGQLESVAISYLDAGGTRTQSPVGRAGRGSRAQTSLNLGGISVQLTCEAER